MFAVQATWAATAISGNGAGVNVPCTGSTYIYVPSSVTYFYVYDDGGTGTYSNSCSGVLSIEGPYDKGFMVETYNAMEIEDNRDTLRVVNSYYFTLDWSDYYLEQMYETSSSGNFGPLYTTGNKMAFKFSTDASVVKSGFVLKVSVVDLDTVKVQSTSGGTISIWDPYRINSVRVGYDDHTTFAPGAKVSLYDCPNNGYFLSGLKVKDASGNLLRITEAKQVGNSYGGDSLQFTMPSSNVTVTPTYSSLSNLSSVDMLCRTATLDIPSGISSFRIYDNGGSSGSYTNYCDAILTLNAPAGYKLKLTGTVSTEALNYDYLKIYDGADTNSSLLATKHSSADGDTLDIGTINSTGKRMTLRFHSDQSKTYSGLNLKATLVAQSFSISKASYSNGTVSVASSASVGSTVTITATPNTNYLLKSLTVTTASGTNVTLTKGSGNTWTFTMPGENVTIKPVFAKDTYTIAYKTAAGGTATGVTSAKVGNTVTVTASPLNSTYLLKDISVVSSENVTVDVTSVKWYNNTAAFIMPFGNVTVTPSFTSDLSANSGLYINMPTTGTVNASIPAGVKSFKVYDDGGNSKNYSKSSNGTLVLTAPTGYVFELTGNVNTGYTSSTCATESYYICNSYTYTCNTNDNLSVYDGSSTSATALVSAKTGCTSSNGPSSSSLGRIVSRGNTMTLNFKSNATGYASAGLDLTVKLVKLALDLADDGNGNKYVDMVAKHKATLTIPDGVTTFNIYDDGGKSGSYMKGVNDTLVLTAPSGYILQLTGNVNTGYTNSTCATESYYICSSYTYTCNANDNLSVYDGSSTTATSLLSNKTSNCTTSSGPSNTSLDRLQSSGQSMTLVFKSSATGYSSSGLDLTVKLVKFAVAINSATGGTIVSSKYSAITNDVISLTATPKSGYMLKGVSVKDALNNVVPATKYSFANAMFTMPSSDVTVIPSWTSTFTADGGLYLDLARNKKVEVNIPTGVKSFKVYDNGGKDGKYANSSRDTLVLKAPAGYHLKVSGNVKTEKGYDSLYIFDGNNTSATKLLSASGPATSNSSNSYMGFSTYSTSGEYMTIRFRSDGVGNYDGLDLTVTLEQLNYTITRASVTGGTLYGKDKDTLGAEVYLTGSDLLSNVSVVDKDNKSVKVTTYTFDRARFTMPASNVTVTPTWATDFTAEGGLHLDMQKNMKWDLDIPIKVKSFNLYDNGGLSGIYEHFSNDTLILNAPTGFYLAVTGSVTLEKGYDSLYIFDGTNTSAAKLFGSTSTTTNTKTDIGTITSSGRSLTFYFKSDGSTQYSGLNLVVSVEPITYGISIANAANGRVSSDKTKAAKDSIVNLSWVYTTGYLIRDIDVKDASENKIVVNGGWYSGAKASFTMPGSPVIVTPTFTNNLTAEGDNGLYINMPKTGTVNATIPNKVTSFKVYDDGGASGLYSNGCNGTLVLNAPEGYLLQLSGSVTTENPNSSGTIYDYLDVYDGADNTATKLVNKKTGSTTISAVRSSSRNLTLLFHSDGGGVSKGLDLTVTLIRLGVEIAEVTGGSMTSDKDVASPGETVTLTATPDEGYLFDGVSVEDKDGNEIALSKDIHWYSGASENAVTFNMPANAVTVTPKFSAVNNLYVNMPKSGTTEITIPEGVTSFKVYDDGGKDGNYSNGTNGTINITGIGGPLVSALKVSGTVASREGDGLSMSAHIMIVGKEFYRYEGSSDGKSVDIGEFTNSSLLMIQFQSDASGNAAGLDLTVSTVPAEYKTGGVVNVMYNDGGMWTDGDLKYKKIGYFNTEYKDDVPVYINKDIDVDTVVYGREFPKGAYSTMMLPFDVNTANIEGPDAVLRYNGIKDNSSIRMKVVWATNEWALANGITGKSYAHTDLDANTPYLVQMKKDSLKVKGPVTLRKTTDPDVTIDNWTFRGTLQYKKWIKGDPELGYAYGFAASASETNNIKVGDFVKVGEGAWIRPLRAYLVKAGISEKAQLARANGAYVKRPTVVPEELPELMSIVIDGDDDNEEHTTVIGHFNTRTGEIKMNYDRGKFDLKGRRVNGEKPNARGAYYGKKATVRRPER
jgi:hypothetical protein